MDPLQLIQNPVAFNAFLERVRQDSFVVDEIDHIRGHNLFHYAARTNLEIFQKVLRMDLEDFGFSRETVFHFLSSKGHGRFARDVIFVRDENPIFGIDPFQHPLIREQKLFGFTPLYCALLEDKLDIARFIYDNCRHYTTDGGITLLSHADHRGRTIANFIVSMRLRDNSEISPEMLIESYRIHFGDNFERLTNAIISNPQIITSVIRNTGLSNAMKIFKQFEGKSHEAFKIASQYLTIMYAEMGDDTVSSSAALDYFLTDAHQDEAPEAPAAAAADAAEVPAAEAEEVPAAAAADAAEVPAAQAEEVPAAAAADAAEVPAAEAEEVPAAAAADAAEAPAAAAADAEEVPAAQAEEVAQVEVPAAQAEEVAQVEAPAAAAADAAEEAPEVEVAGDLPVQNADIFA
jgi:hypothetical protein